jgi:hypothetical protein
MDNLRIINKIARDILSKERPNTLFEQAFFDLRLKMKDLKHDAALKVIKKIEDSMRHDLIQQGYIVKDLELKIGSFRGSDYVTTAKTHIQMNDEKKANELATYMQQKYSPKFKFKGLENSIAEFNIR